MKAKSGKPLSSVLFITYDGLLDPLGGSQILPYLYQSIPDSSYLHILSFEKSDRFIEGAERLQVELGQRGIGWSALSFTSRVGKIGKIWDLLRMYATAIYLHYQYRFLVIHCRSYQAMQVGSLLRRLTGAKTIFDMRGLWVDERIDGGLWLRYRWSDRIAYVAYKGIEKKLLASATLIIALTHRVVPELKRLSPAMTSPVRVIPCCADFDHFQLLNPAERYDLRAELGIATDVLVLSYLGSLGTWYLLDDMLRFFALAQGQWGDVHLLLITRDWSDRHESLLITLGLERLRDRIHVRAAERDEVPALLGVTDVMLSFIKPAYSKMASSPTKLAEAFAVGLPVISNMGIGDVDEITRTLGAGALVDLTDPASISEVIERLPEIRGKGGTALRARARPVLGLEVAATAYREVYRSLESLT